MCSKKTTLIQTLQIGTNVHKATLIPTLQILGTKPTMIQPGAGVYKHNPDSVTRKRDICRQTQL